MNEKTEPCPWCEHVGVEYFEPSTYRYGAAMCGECGAVGPEIRKDGKETREEWAPRALAAWNARAASPSSKSTKEAVDRLLFDIRGAMLRYGSAFKKGDEDGIRSTSTEACELLDRLAALASSSTKEDGWKDAVLDKLAITCMDAPIGTPPADILDTIIRWHVQVALDPAVSRQAQDLIDKGASSTKEDGGGGEPCRVGWFVFTDGEWRQTTRHAEGALPLYEIASPPSPLGDTPEGGA